MAYKLGLDCKLFYNVVGIGGGGTWEELSNAKDVTLGVETGEADATTRGNNGWKATVATLKDASIEFEMVWNTDDAGFQAIKDAWLNKTPIGIAALDGALNSGEGLVADMMVMNFSRSEPLEGVATVSITLKPTFSANAPQWVEDGI